MVLDFFEAHFEDSGITIGTFDGIHIAHRRLIEETLCTSEKWGLNPIVLTFSKHKYKGKEQLTTLREKIYLMEQIGVKNILLMDERVFPIRAEEFLREHLHRRLGLKWLFLGYNHRFGYKREGDASFALRFADELEFSITALSPIKVEGIRVSSSTIRKFLKEGNLQMANRLLGYNYFMTGKVVKGAGMGKKIGFPTANLQIPPEKLIPAEGVYAVWVHLKDERYRGAMHIGRRETLNLPPSVEVHILDFEGNITGEEIRAELVHYIRKPMKFDSVEDLRKQIERDIGRVREVLK